MYTYYTNLKKIRDFVGKTLININKSKILTIEMIFFLENRFVILYLGNSDNSVAITSLSTTLLLKSTIGISLFKV